MKKTYVAHFPPLVASFLLLYQLSASDRLPRRRCCSISSGLLSQLLYVEFIADYIPDFLAKHGYSTAIIVVFIAQLHLTFTKFNVGDNQVAHLQGQLKTEQAVRMGLERALDQNKKVSAPLPCEVPASAFSPKVGIYHPQLNKCQTSLLHKFRSFALLSSEMRRSSFVDR